MGQPEVDRHFSDVSTQVESTEVFECEAQTEAVEPLVMEYFVVADQPGFSLEDSFLEDHATQTVELEPEVGLHQVEVGTKTVKRKARPPQPTTVTWQCMVFGLIAGFLVGFCL